MTADFIPADGHVPANDVRPVRSVDVEALSPEDREELHGHVVDCDSAAVWDVAVRIRDDALAAATARAEAAEAREAALRAGVEALAPACWVYRSTEVTCTDLVGGELPNGATWVEDMCCLPCRLRALLATGGAE